MKNIKDLTEQDCIRCSTQEEWDGICKLAGIKFNDAKWGHFLENSIVFPKSGTYYNKGYAEAEGYTIHPASDFLTPQVSVLTEIGDCKVIRHNDGCIVIKDDKAMTLTKDIVNWIKQNI